MTSNRISSSLVPPVKRCGHVMSHIWCLKRLFNLQPHNLQSIDMIDTSSMLCDAGSLLFLTHLSDPPYRCETSSDDWRRFHCWPRFPFCNMKFIYDYVTSFALQKFKYCSCWMCWLDRTSSLWPEQKYFWLTFLCCNFLLEFYFGRHIM